MGKGGGGEGNERLVRCEIRVDCGEVAGEGPGKRTEIGEGTSLGQGRPLRGYGGDPM